MSAPGRAYRPEIDGLRAVAVLAVAFYHAFPAFVPGGFVGVDVFFVISGYLITDILVSGEAGAAGLATFYQRRVRRIFPALVPMLAATLAAGWAWQVAFVYKATAKHVVGAALFSTNILLWREAGYFDIVSKSKPLLHLWSLGIEEQFYLVWPLVLLFLPWRVKGRRALAYGVLLISFAWGLFWAGSLDGGGFYAPWCRAWELMAGAALALQGPVRIHPGAAWVGLAMIAAVAFGLHPGDVYPGWRALAPVTGAVLVLAAAPGGAHRALSRRPLVRIGLVSYGFYLWHWPVLVFARLLSPWPAPNWVSGGALVAAMILALASERWLERPFRRPGSSPARAWLAAGALALVAAIAGLIYMADGLPGRPVAVGLSRAPWDFKATRTTRCHLDATQAADFADECGPQGPAGAPLVLLWGDSYAGCLYPALRELQEEGRIRLAQYTSAGCPPDVGCDLPHWPHCRQDNDAALAQVVRFHPDWVVLAGNWRIYQSGLVDKVPYDAVALTVRRLKRLGVPRVLVFGQCPFYLRPLIEELARLRRAGAPYRIARTLAPGCGEADRAIEAAARAAGADFYSPMRLFCDQATCRGSLKDHGLVPVSLDQGHLTLEGARYLIQHSPLGRLGLPPGSSPSSPQALH